MAEFERELVIERTQAGLSSAKAEGTALSPRGGMPCLFRPSFLCSEKAPFRADWVPRWNPRQHHLDSFSFAL